MNPSKLMMIAGALTLCCLFAFPIWTITLSAPQYPEALGMDIWINRIADMNPNDLKNINLMNHYIGMEDIPEHIPEMDFIWKVVLFMIGLGVAIGFTGNRKLYLTWFILMSIAGLIGVYDFWLWEYTYGHNLNPTAAIQFVDELGNPLAYQPPLIGTKTILNFVATSMPNIGAYGMFLGMSLVFGSIFVKKKT